MESYCQMSNYCYACFLVDPQDPEVLCNGLCYHCHASRWDKMKHGISDEALWQTLNRLSVDSKWFNLYSIEYKRRVTNQ
jgi:hypothetical protein